jgi:hypothetical protein
MTRASWPRTTTGGGSVGSGVGDGVGDGLGEGVGLGTAVGEGAGVGDGGAAARSEHAVSRSARTMAANRVGIRPASMRPACRAA